MRARVVWLIPTLLLIWLAQQYSNQPINNLASLEYHEQAAHLLSTLPSHHAKPSAWRAARAALLHALEVQQHDDMPLKTQPSSLMARFQALVTMLQQLGAPCPPLHGASPPTNTTLFLAANLHRNQAVMPHFVLSVLRLAAQGYV